MKPVRGFVYFMQQDVTGAVKIGYSGTLRGIEGRLASLQTGSPYPVRLIARTPGTPLLERALHKKFGQHRLRGEWFVPCPELLTELAQFQASPDSPTPAAAELEPLARQRRLQAQRRPRGVVEKKGRWYYRPPSTWERIQRAARGLPETIPLGKADTVEARRKWAALQEEPRVFRVEPVASIERAEQDQTLRSENL